MPDEDGRMKGKSPLFAGTEAIFLQTLGIANVRHRSSWNTVSRTPPAANTLASTVEGLFVQVSNNWAMYRAATDRLASSQNWRWGQPVTSIADRNRSPEVVLERAIVRTCVAAGRRDWSNQIPIASGVVDPHSHRRSAIDLVHQCGASEFEFLELKVASDTPLSAAVEIIQYGCVWLLSRRDSLSLCFGNLDLLEAAAVRLCVLAPSTYYGSGDICAVAEGLNAGVQALGRSQGGVSLSFEFQEFSDALLQPQGYTSEEALAIIDGRRTIGSDSNND